MAGRAIGGWGIIWHHSILEVAISLPLSIFSPDPQQLTASSVIVTEESIVVKLIASSPSACCPICTQPSQRVHSRYRRIIADLPSQGRTVRLDVFTRRWFCRNPTCRRRIFTERLAGVTSPYARRTTRLAILVEAIALALGGEGAVRILDVLCLALGSDALLNVIRQATEADMPAPEVVGIDDWAWRRGHRYGTIIVDLERHAVADLLPDRVVESVVTWLQRHPEINTIARDRGGIYAEAATKGAPQATQVADRWHLLHNLTDALEEFLLHHRVALREAATVVSQSEPEGEIEPEPVGVVAVATRAKAATASEDASSLEPVAPNRPCQGKQRQEEASRQRHARIVEQYEAVRRLLAVGANAADIARQAGISRLTVYRYRDLPGPPEPRRPNRSSRERLLAPYEPYLLQRWQEGCHNGMRLYREIEAKGYAYCSSNVSRFVAQLRREEASGQRVAAGAPRTPSRVPTARKVAGLYLRRPEDLKPEEHIYLRRLTETSPELATAYRLTQDFALMVRERQDSMLDGWLAEAEACEVSVLRRFAKGIREDLAAVQAGLREEWSNGPTEGFINKLKLLKRQAYGRAGFAVLRQRMLRAA